MNRPATVITTFVVVLLHALLQLGRTVAAGIGLAAFVLTHPRLGSTPAVLLSSALGVLLGLVLVVGDVVLVLWFWRAAPRARVVLTVWLSLASLLTLGSVVTWLSAAASPSMPLVALSIFQLLLCVAAVVLLWLRPTNAWLSSASVRPAGPGR